MVSYIVSGAFTGTFLLNHHLYWVNFVIILLLAGRQFPAFSDNVSPVLNARRWLLFFAGIIAIIMLLSLITVSIHGDLPGTHDRFRI
jgi:hypothetical protein